MLSKFDFATSGEIECNGAIFEINTSNWQCENCQGIKFTGELK